MLEALDREGWVVMADALDAAWIERLRRAFDAAPAQVNGTQHVRLAPDMPEPEAWRALETHEAVIAAAEHVLGGPVRVRDLHGRNPLPGHGQQGLHADAPERGEGEPFVVATALWMIDDFTADNGATVLYPGSHRWGKRRPGPDDEALPVVMPAGSCVFFVGTLWHGGGANTTTADRLAVTAQYCQPWLRPMEAFTLSVSRDIARAVSGDIRRMLGYSIHPPFVGAVDGLHPLRLLEDQ